MYSIKIERRARKALAALPERVYQRVMAAIHALADMPRPPGCKKLADQDAYRVRVGDYRVIYEVNDQELRVVVVDVGHRREAYR